MTLRDHKKIGQVVLKHVESMRFACCTYADLALNESFNDVSESALVHFKAHMLMLGALEDLCNKYDFDLIYEGDFENE